MDRINIWRGTQIFTADLLLCVPQLLWSWRKPGEVCTLCCPEGIPAEPRQKCQMLPSPTDGRRKGSAEKRRKENVQTCPIAAGCAGLSAAERAGWLCPVLSCAMLSRSILSCPILSCPLYSQDLKSSFTFHMAVTCSVWLKPGNENHLLSSIYSLAFKNRACSCEPLFYIIFINSTLHDNDDNCPFF